MQISFNIIELLKFSQVLRGVGIRLNKSCFTWTQRLTKFTLIKMKRFSLVKRRKQSSRAIGYLSNSISSIVRQKADMAEGQVYVPRGVPYQFAHEYGFKNWKYKAIQAKKLMVFNKKFWDVNIKSTEARFLIRRGQKGDFYYFKVVSRGKYEGVHYTLNSYLALVEYYNQNKDRMAKAAMGAISLTTNV